MALIAERAQVGSGTIYRYFKDKEKLVNELFGYWKMELFKAMKEGLPENLPLRALFHETWQRWVTFALQNRDAMLFLIAHHHAPYLDQTSLAINEKFHHEYMLLFKSGQREQIIKDADPELIMAVVIGIFSEIMREYWAGHLEMTPEVIEQTEEACWQAIRR